MKEAPGSSRTRLWPWGVAAAAVLVWTVLTALEAFPSYAFPTPQAVGWGLLDEIRTGRLYNDVVASLFRVGAGFGLGVVLGIPLGLALAHHPWLRAALMPFVNFFRSLSPLAWMPFAILWFGIGDPPSIFLIFLASFFPLVLASAVCVTGIPSVYFRVAQDHGIHGWELMWRVTLPAILPQVIVALRVTAGMAWVVVVAAEMVAGRDGLGFAIMDARNGLRTDLVVVGMIVIGCLGLLIDRVLMRLTRIPSVRWGYER